MSGLTTIIQPPLTDDERVASRRFCGYSVYGPGASGFEGWRFFQAYGMLEYRLTNLAQSELTNLRQYLGQIATLETEILGSTSKIDIDTAAVFKRNTNAMFERNTIFDNWRIRLCGFLGIPPGPEMQGQGRRIIV